jgi:hypothetical protein
MNIQNGVNREGKTILACILTCTADSPFFRVCEEGIGRYLHDIRRYLRHITDHDKRWRLKLVLNNYTLTLEVSAVATTVMLKY